MISREQDDGVVKDTELLQGIHNTSHLGILMGDQSVVIHLDDPSGLRAEGIMGVGDAKTRKIGITVCQHGLIADGRRDVMNIVSGYILVRGIIRGMRLREAAPDEEWLIWPLLQMLSKSVDAAVGHPMIHMMLRRKR